MNTPNEDPNTVENSAYHPFPEPQTIPSGWDLTGMLSTPVDHPQMKEEDSTDQ